MYKVGDILRQKQRLRNCKCGCCDTYKVIDVSDVYVLQNTRTNHTFEHYGDVDDFYEIIEKEKSKTGFGKFICRIED